MNRRARLLAIVLLAGLTGLGWNPIATRQTEPYRWPSTGPVVWNPDGGVLGLQSNSAANGLVTNAFGEWQDVTTSAITFAQGPQIVDTLGNPVDVTAVNYAEIVNCVSPDPCGTQNPIIYDNQREIFDLLGRGSGVLGFAGILRVNPTLSTITKAYAVLEGDWIDGEPQGTPPSDPGEVNLVTFLGVMVHEFGHFSGLGHVSVNHEVGALPGCPPPLASQIETMSPFITFDAASLHYDDEIGISALYPTTAFGTDFASISGRLFDRDGVTGFDGANVVLRPDVASCNDRYNLAQATQSGSNPGETGGPGTYLFPGLQPTAGHTLLVTQIGDGGSYPIGGTSPPPLGGPEDFYNGADESHFDPPDDPTQVVSIVTGAGGSTLPGIDMRINNADFPGAVLGAGLEPLVAGKFDGETPLDSALVAADDGTPEFGAGDDGLITWMNRFALPPELLPFRIEEIHIMFGPGLGVAVGRPIQLLVYTDPSGSGHPMNSTLAYSEPAAVQSLSFSTFNEFVLSTPVTVTTGDFYVGAADGLVDSANTLIALLDGESPVDRTAWVQVNGISPSEFTQETDGPWMVRVFGSIVPAAGTLFLTWGESCNESSVPDQDYAVYAGTFGNLGGVQDHEPLTCSTGTMNFYELPEGLGDRYFFVAPYLAGIEGDLETGTGGRPRTPLSTCGTIMPGSCLP